MKNNYHNGTSSENTDACLINDYLSH